MPPGSGLMEEETVVEDEVDEEMQPGALMRYRLQNVGNETCESEKSLCSCKWKDCQCHQYASWG